MELTTSLSSLVETTRPLLELSNLFHQASVYRHNFCLNNDDASPQKLLEVVEYSLRDLTVREMIDIHQEEFEYNGENIWPCIFDLQSIVSQYPHQIPNWQLKMAAMRLEKLANQIITYSLHYHEKMECF